MKEVGRRMSGGGEEKEKKEEEGDSGQGKRGGWKD